MSWYRTVIHWDPEVDEMFTTVSHREDEEWDEPSYYQSLWDDIITVWYTGDD